MSFFFTIVYLILEYIRPQQMYNSIAAFPLAQIAIICLIISFILEGRKLNNSGFQNILIVGFFICIFISYLFAYKPDLAWQPMVDFLKLVIIYFLLINTINDKKKLYLFTILFLLILFKQTQFILRYLVTHGFQVPKDGMYGAGGPLSNSGDLGTALVSFFGISYFMIRADTRKMFGWLKMRWFHIFCAFSMVLSIFATNSRGPTLALAISFVVIWYKGKRKVLGIVGIAIVAMTFVFIMSGENLDRFMGSGTKEDKTGQQRVELWNAGLRMANENPFTGVGPNNFVYVNRKIYSSEYHLVQHNTFVQALSELGYPGLILFIIMILGCFNNQIKIRKLLRVNRIEDNFLYYMSHGLDIGLIGFIVAGFFVSVLFYPFFWMLLIINVSLLDVSKQLSNLNSLKEFKNEKVVKN